jgi:hypothetical protein
MIYQGEFLPVLAWEDLTGVRSPLGKPVAMVVLRPRLALPIERLLGMISPSQDAWLDAALGEAREPWIGGTCRVGALTLSLVDPDRLITMVQALRRER